MNSYDITVGALHDLGGLVINDLCIGTTKSVPNFPYSASISVHSKMESNHYF